MYFAPIKLFKFVNNSDSEHLNRATHTFSTKSVYWEHTRVKGKKNMYINININNLIFNLI